LLFCGGSVWLGEVFLNILAWGADTSNTAHQTAQSGTTNKGVQVTLVCLVVEQRLIGVDSHTASVLVNQLLASFTKTFTDNTFGGTSCHATSHTGLTANKWAQAPSGHTLNTDSV
jgi:hypothetical protein